MYSQAIVDEVLNLVAAGTSYREIAARTGISRGAIANWRHGRTPSVVSRDASPCPRCEDAGRFEAERGSDYAYLLGQYLGDGCVFRNTTSYMLRISSDARYVGIIAECCRAIELVSGRPPKVRFDSAKRMANIFSYWRSWPCLIPQHGRGRKHARPIALATWQVDIVEAHAGRFLRGLIHSDGWRGLNRVTVKGRDYAYPRYQFSNRSDDIRTLFTYACQLVGVDWRPWGKWHISVARRESLARLDEFVGPKS